jgi:hypothetical protein
MQLASKCGLAAIAVAAVLALGGPAPSQESPVLLTVTGAVEKSNRGAFDPDLDKLFEFNDVSFDEAVEFDLETLRKLPQVTVKADFPMGGAVQEFTGPRLADLLAAAGATGDKVMVQALDGYAVEAPLTEMVDKGAVVALERNGTPLGIGGFGPAQIVFPRAERPDLAEMTDDGWVWQIYHIRVE